MRRPLVAFICLLGVCWFMAHVCLVSPPNTALGQDKSKGKASKKKVGSSNVLDVKAGEIQGEFMKSAEGLAEDYYKLKEYDKARSLLKSIQALDPNRAGLDAKFKLLDDDLINANEVEIEMNLSQNEWVSTGVVVGAGKPIRLTAAGSYKFVVSSQLGPGGYATGKTPGPLDLVGELPLGALIGFVTPSERPAGGQQDEKKRDRPFLIGEGGDYTPQKDGILSIKVNAPPDNKNSGKLKVLITGGVRVLK